MCLNEAGDGKERLDMNAIALAGNFVVLVPKKTGCAVEAVKCVGPAESAAESFAGCAT